MVLLGPDLAQASGSPLARVKPGWRPLPHQGRLAEKHVRFMSVFMSSGDAGASVLWKWNLSRPAAAPQRIFLFAAEDLFAVSGRKQEALGVGEPEFSPDLLRLVFRNDDVAEIWDVESGSRLGSLPLPNEYAELAFSADGHHLLVLDNDRLMKIAIADADLRRRACDVAGRPFTESEATRYLGGRRDVRPCTAIR